MKKEIQKTDTKDKNKNNNEKKGGNTGIGHKIAAEKSGAPLVQEEQVREILRRLDERYGRDIKTYLQFDVKKPWQLLFSTILSAQCTDARVNLVTKDLYVKYPTIEAFAQADVKEMEQDIHSIGFFHNKARNLIACARKLLSDFKGEVPQTIEELTSLPGVGRKTANVVRGNIFGQPSIVVDTHVKRVANRLGLTDETDPTKVEYDLMKILPEDHWILINLQGIALGREICKAPRPRCEDCFLQTCCRYFCTQHS